MMQMHGIPVETHTADGVAKDSALFNKQRWQNVKMKNVKTRKQ